MNQLGIDRCANAVTADLEVYPSEDVFAAGERNHHISNTAYPIAHGQTFKPYRIKRENNREVIANAFDGCESLCLYSHIPFCESRCYFCEYTVVGKNELDQTEIYMNALNQEVKMYRELIGPRTLESFDIGGGTPSFPDTRLIEQHIETVTDNFSLGNDFEISIETTPRIAALEPDKLTEYYRMGIRRISMGVQVTQPDLLKVLGRDSNGLEHHRYATDHVRRAGFTKFNLDLMYGFAGQSTAAWQATLEHAIALDPEYITLYRMRYKLTRISHQADQVKMKQISEQAELAKEFLKAGGYLANPGKNTYSRVPQDTGTSGYLTRRVVQGMPYLGVGLGAQSFSHSTISYNSGAVGKNLLPYLRDINNSRLPIQDLYHLPAVHMMAKMIAVSFYFGEINLDAFQNKFGVSLEDAYPNAIEFALNNGFMYYSESTNGSEIVGIKNNCLSLTALGARVFNGVIALFFAPSVQKYLIECDGNTNKDMQINRITANKIANQSEKMSLSKQVIG